MHIWMCVLEVTLSEGDHVLSVCLFYLYFLFPGGWFSILRDANFSEGRLFGGLVG